MSLKPEHRRGADKPQTPAIDGRYEAGRQRLADILVAAKATLVKGGYAQLTVRRVATEAGLPLRHLQYYYPTKDELLSALCESICDDYIEKCDALAARTQSDPKSQFIACIDYLIEDNRNTTTNTIMVELWALSCHDKTATKFVTRLLDYYREYIAKFIRRMRPAASAELVEMRTLQVIALIEGLALFIGGNRPKISAARNIAADARRNILRIVLSK
ncbi:MAG: TetR/AcrR family transcriptional regulator [Gammaproteobacteria bacterium]